jgi:hypothetical protein
MKYCALILLIINIVLLSIIFHSHTDHKIKWSNYKAPFIVEGKKIVIITGLRSDGVLVWKENKEIVYNY